MSPLNLVDAADAGGALNAVGELATAADVMPRRWWRHPVVIGALVLVALVSVRVVVSGNAAAARGAAAVERLAKSSIRLDASGHPMAGGGDVVVVRDAYREALSWTLAGFGGWRLEAQTALWAQVRVEQARGDDQGQVATLTALRSGFMGARVPWDGEADLRAEVDAALAPAMARWERSAAAVEGREDPGALEARTVHYATVLTQDHLPHRGYGALTALGFLAWLGFAFGATRVQGRGRWIRLALSIAGLAAMLIGTALA